MRRALAIALAVLAFLVDSAGGAERGQAEVGLQGYFLSGNSQPGLAINGAAVRFQYLSSRYGLFRGNLEGYGGEGRMRFGDNFLEVSGLPWNGMRWTLTGGDLRLPLTFSAFPFQNIYYPEAGLRGFKVEAGGRNYKYRLLWGRETLISGPRVSYRVDAPQRLFSAGVERKLGKHLLLSTSWIRLDTVDADKPESRFFFNNNRFFDRVNRVGVQALYTPTQHLRFFGETSASRVAYRDKDMAAARLSSTAGVAYETERWTVRTNYIRQSAGYLPLAGYYLGDREGPFGEVRSRIHPRLEVFGSASRYGSNIEGRGDTPSIRSWSGSLGSTVTLPFRLSASGQITVLNYKSRPSSDEPFRLSNNRQINLSLARPIARHTLRLSARTLKLGIGDSLDYQRSGEVEDSFSWRRWLLGGAARWQQATTAGQNRQSLFYRGLVRGAFGPLTAYGNYEAGNDLVNRTVFATSTMRMLGAGLSVRMGHWDLQVDTFRNNFISSLNPESVFLLETRGFGQSLFLSEFDQWNVYFRLSRQFNWGGELPVLDRDEFGGAHIPLLGSVEGFVFERFSTGRQPLAGIPVVLDSARRAVTDAQGSYSFHEVPEGAHMVAVSPDELPAEFNPAGPPELRAVVSPKRIARVDLEIERLGAIEGVVSAPADLPLSSIVIVLRSVSSNLEPRSTTVDDEGRFAFFNVTQGDYEVAIDVTSLPENTRLSGSASVAVKLSVGLPLQPVQFTIEAQTGPEKRVRKIQLQ